MKRSAAEILREYGPFPGVERVHGVTYDGEHVWFAAGDTLNAFDPVSGKPLRSIEVAARAGTAFDGQHLFQLAKDRIQKIGLDFLFPRNPTFELSPRRTSSSVQMNQGVCSSASCSLNSCPCRMKAAVR